MSTKNSNLHSAKNAKNDEFYTQLSDVSEELRHYKKHFKGKTVFCNCDDPTWSAFWKYFHLNFEVLGLKKLISTHYNKDEPTYKMVYEGGDDNDIEVGVKTPLQGNGDFRNEECIELLKESDIVVTNPPFSLFREYVAQLMEYNKSFLIVGPRNAISYGEIFPYIRDNKMWLGNGFRNGNAYFSLPQYADVSQYAEGVYNPEKKLVKFRNCTWFTNLDLAKRHEKLILWESYSSDKFPTYENYKAINVDKISTIPADYDGVMGVPITFLDKYNPQQFEIIGQTNKKDMSDATEALRTDPIHRHGGWINGKEKYMRILIRKK